MDSTHIHLLLDRIREEQHHQGRLLLDIADQQEEGLRLLRSIFKTLRERAAPAKRLPHGSVSTGIQYLMVLAAVVYMVKGGDLDRLGPLVKLEPPRDCRRLFGLSHAAKGTSFLLA
jgi:hypothetical protein